MDTDEEQWTQAVHRGARLLFWAAVATAVLDNLGAFAIPLIGGTHEDLKWVVLISTVGAVIMVFGVFSMTTREPGANAVRDGFGRIAQIAVILYVFTCLGMLISLGTVKSAKTHYLIIAQNLAYPAAALTLFLYIRVLTVRFGLRKLTRVASTLVWLFPTVSLALPLISDVFEISLRPGRPVFYVDIVLVIGVGIWALRLIWTFGSIIALAAKGRCLHCGYPLTGLSECRCSECGTHFTQSWAGADATERSLILP